MRFAWTVTICVLLASMITASTAAEKQTGTGFFRVKNINGVWWFIDPNGELFYSIGLTDCRGYHLIWQAPGTDSHDEGVRQAETATPSAAEWARIVKGWGFNTTGWRGNWNDRMYTAPVALFWRKSNHSNFTPLPPKDPKYGVADVYSPGFADWCDRWAKKVIAPYADSPLIIGWFIDNEVHLPADAGFQRQFFKVVTAAIRKYDKNHLLLGMRHEFPNRSAMEIKIEAEFCDVLSVNNYGGTPQLLLLDRMYRLSGKPILIGEFAFGSKEHSHPADHVAAGTLVKTTADRAIAYEIYTSAAAARPYIVGTHYYRFTPFQTNDWGIVGDDGKIWKDFVAPLAEINRRLPMIHARKIKPKHYSQEFIASIRAHNDRPHYKRGTRVAEDGFWLWQDGLWYWECTPGTQLLTYKRGEDGEWGQKKNGFLEYRFDLKKPMPDAHLYVRYAGLPNVDVAQIQIAVNGQPLGSYDVVVDGVGDSGPDTYANGFGAFRYSMTCIPLKTDLKPGENRIRLSVDKPWPRSGGLIIHGFFITAGKRDVTAKDYGKLDNTKK